MTIIAQYSRALAISAAMLAFATPQLRAADADEAGAGDVAVEQPRNPTGTDAIFKAWDDLPEEGRSLLKRNEEVKKIVELGPRVLPDLIKSAGEAGAEKAPPSGALAICALGSLLENDITAAKNPAVAALVPVATGRKNYEHRRLALNALDYIGDINVIPSLVPALDTSKEIEKTVEIREHQKTLNITAQTLASLTRKDGGADLLVQEFQKYVEKASDPFKVRMIQTLREVDSSQGESMLLYFITDRSDLVKYNAISALGFTKPRLAPGILMEVLRGNDMKLRKGAIVALGRFKWVPAIPDISKLLDSPESGVHTDAAASLRLITGINFTNRKDAMDWYAAETADSLKRFEGLAAKLKAASREELPVVIEQFHSIVLHRDKVVDLLLQYAGHEFFRARAAACTVLGRTGSMRALTTLVSRISDATPEVSYAAWRALKESTGRSFPRDTMAWTSWLSKRG
jgi:HEAT repeat protein